MFQSAAYLSVFLVCVAVLAKVASPTVRQAVLLVASYGLYLTWTRWFAAVLIFSVVMNYLLGKWLRRNPTAARLWVGICLNVLLLGAFKYVPEISVQIAITSLKSFSHIALPLGISFWTFQALSYLFDVYRGSRCGFEVGSMRMSASRDSEARCESGKTFSFVRSSGMRLGATFAGQ